MFPVETISAKMLDYYVGRRDTLIIDLREKEFYMHSHVKGAVNMPYGEIDGYTAFPKGKILVLYCDRGEMCIRDRYMIRAEVTPNRLKSFVVQDILEDCLTICLLYTSRCV